MKRLVTFIAVFLASISAGWATPPAPLTTLRQVADLKDTEASQRLPVAFEATVTYYDKLNNTLFVQDEGTAIFVGPKTDAELLPGDRVLVRGTTRASLRPIVISESVTLLHHGHLPKPEPATFDELIQLKHDCMVVTVQGIVQAADVRLFPKGSADLTLYTEGGYIAVIALNYPSEELDKLLDAEVEITGVAGGLFDGKMHVVGVSLKVSSPSDIRILKGASIGPWSLPLTPMDRVITRYHISDHTQRVRVHGIVTHYQPGISVVLQDGAKSLWVATRTHQPMRLGDVVEATGFPESRNGFLALTRGEIRDSHINTPVQPIPTTINELGKSHHVLDLVTVEAQVVTEARGAWQDEYDLNADGHLFTAIYLHPPDIDLKENPMKPIPVGSRIRVTGICITEDSNPYLDQVPFDILMRTFDDIEVVASPSMVNIRNLTIVVGLLLVVVFFAIARSWAVERKVRRQTAALAATEQRRSRILVDINGSRPLAEIIEEITEFVSFQLGGAPCWCQIVDGARLGNFPPQISAQRIAQKEISARSGPPLGVIYVAFDKVSKPSAAEEDTLSMTAGLTALAIETRRLYSDLHRRSEFDLLTDIHNRFALEKRLDLQIEEAHHKAGVFGLIYIDLDKFKPINDHYGHHIGDLYLQEVALRMKSQLRGADILARLGGDEFGALIAEARSRDGVEEIAYRLERCFDQPFLIEGIRILGAASFGIALYPEDGVTRDELLNAADTAMYAVKNKKKPEAATVT
ncbi:MAG: GGDEF domain-containing protein [Terracidiphilus sp.]